MLKQLRSPALGFSLAAALAAWLAGRLMPMVGGPAFGIIIGLILGNLFPRPRALPAAAFGRVSKLLLAVSLSLLGFGLSLRQVAAAGVSSLAVLLFTLTAAFLTAFIAGRRLAIPYRLTALIGMGTAICGGSAIAALAPVIKAEAEETAYAVSTIFLYNLLAVFLFPPLAHLLNLSDLGFGLWAGTAINDTSSVLAAAYAFGPEAGDYGAVVKLTRTTLIVPLCLIFAAVTARRENGAAISAGRAFQALPRFIIYFLLASVLTTLGWLPESLTTTLSDAAKLMIIWALTAVGLGSDLRQMAARGLRPFGLGLAVWAAVAVSALLAQYFTGRW